MQLRQWMLALSGNEAISNGITREAERLGLTPQSRARKEREQEQERRVAELAKGIREQAERLSKRLDLLDQASMEALLENEELQRAARGELKRIRERAYEITMPDGNVAKVYRDGDKVRAEDGTEVSSDILRASDMPDGTPTWAERGAAAKRADELSEEAKAIGTYRDTLQTARERASDGDLSPDEIDKLELRLDETMPGSVRRHLAASEPAPDRAPAGPDKPNSLISRFTDAVSGATPAPKAAALDDRDFDLLPSHSSFSAPAPK